MSPGGRPVANRRRSTLLILVGAIVFVIGGGGVLFVVSRSGHPQTRVVAQGPAAAPAASTPAVSTGAGATSTPIGAASLHIPAGMVAVAVQVGSIPAVNGYPVAGDKVDVFGQFTKTQPSGTPLKVPFVQLELNNVTVLAVHEPAPSTTPGTTAMVLAVSPASAERLIYLETYQGLYTALVPAHQPAATTPGRGAANILSPT